MRHRNLSLGWSLAGLGVLTCLLMAVTSEQARAGGVWYVKPSGSSSQGCTSWADACDLQTALGKASAGDEIWVAEGIHTPGALRDDTFQLVPGVVVYGGFGGTESDRGERDPASHVTVLSGDIDGNDTTDAHGVVTSTNHITGSNSYHVVTSSDVTETAVLDGFTVTAGQATGIGVDDYGGGMLNDEGSPTLRNLTFGGNIAEERGGAMYNYACTPTLTYVTFSGNRARSGGAMHSRVGSKPRVTNALFSGNRSEGGGGAVYNRGGSSLVLVNVTFSANHSERRGGAIHNFGGSTATLTNCILWGNTAITESQIYNSPNSTSTVASSDVEDSGGSGIGWYSALGIDAGNNLDDDPRFVDFDGSDNITGTLDDNLRLQAGSPAIDAGDDAAVPAGVIFDLDGRPRIAGLAVDMGAYEADAVYRVYLPLVIRSD